MSDDTSGINVSVLLTKTLLNLLIFLYFSILKFLECTRLVSKQHVSSITIIS